MHHFEGGRKRRRKPNSRLKIRQLNLDLGGGGLVIYLMRICYIVFLPNFPCNYSIKSFIIFPSILPQQIFYPLNIFIGKINAFLNFYRKINAFYLSLSNIIYFISLYRKTNAFFHFNRKINAFSLPDFRCGFEKSIFADFFDTIEWRF